MSTDNGPLLVWMRTDDAVRTGRPVRVEGPFSTLDEARGWAEAYMRRVIEGMPIVSGDTIDELVADAERILGAGMGGPWQVARVTGIGWGVDFMAVPEAGAGYSERARRVALRFGGPVTHWVAGWNHLGNPRVHSTVFGGEEEARAHVVAQMTGPVFRDSVGDYSEQTCLRVDTAIDQISEDRYDEVTLGDRSWQVVPCACPTPNQCEST